MEKLISCAFNMDTACVELRFSDGSICSIDTIAVENEIACNMYERSELDYLIYNDPLAYADLILNGDPEVYLKTVTEYNRWTDINKIAANMSILLLLAALFDLDFTYLVFLISHGNPNMITVSRKSKQNQLSERRH